MVYQWRDGARFKGDAQEIGERLEEIADRNEGGLTPARVVEDARDEASPLHEDFEWDDSIAAQMQRESQARSIIRSVRVVKTEDEVNIDGESVEEVQIAYVSVGEPVKGGAKYVTTAEAMSDDEMRARVLGDAFRSFKALRERYGHLNELAGVFDAIDEAAGVIAAH